MPAFLVTFCNAGHATVALVGESGIEHRIALDLGALTRPVAGTVGASFHEGRCYIAVQSDPPAVAVYREDWTLDRVIEPDEVKDIHGIAVLGDDLLIASTGSNQIVAHDLRSGKARAFWTEPSALVDTEHLNDLSVAGRRVLASRFGRREAAGPRSGSVFDAATGECLVRNLREPHSVTTDGEGVLHVLDSPSGDLLRCPSGFSPRRALGIVGYARGLAVGRTIAIGKSGYRRQSRSGLGDARLMPLAPTEAAQEAFALSGVFLVDCTTGSSRFVDTTAIGPEVYAVVETLFPPPAAPGANRPTRRRGRPASRG